MCGPTIRELDVRAIPPKEEHSTIFRTFDVVAKGGAFVLINAPDPKPLYYQFQYERNGEFDWTYLKFSPCMCRTQISGFTVMHSSRIVRCQEDEKSGSKPFALTSS